MAGDLIPADVRDFIIQYIVSVAQLEALILLRANPDRGWDVPSVARRLYTDEDSIAQVLSKLTRDGFLKSDGASYRYDCDDARRMAVDRVVETYAKQLISVTKLIHAQPDRIRQFADAFKFRKDR